MLTTRRALGLAASALVLSAVALESAPAEAQDPTYATFPSHNPFGAGTRNMEEATAFCRQACDVHPVTGGAHCPRVPLTADGFLQASDARLKPIPKMPYVEAGRDVRATQEVIDGLQRLSGEIAALKAKDTTLPAFKGVRVNNCWREGRTDTQKECYFVLKGTNPQSLGLGFPGANAHSGGKACDIVLVDKNDVEATACSAEQKFKTPPAIPFKEASDLLDRLMTSAAVGAKRLDYEAWHYEWGGPSDHRCVYPQCMQDHWPPLCKPAHK